jgi:hypothetical protein
VFVMGFVRADRVVARPLAVVQAFTERQSSFMKWSANGHDQCLKFELEPGLRERAT